MWEVHAPLASQPGRHPGVPPHLTASGSGSQNGEAGYCSQSLWELDDPTRGGLGEEPAGVPGRGHRGWPWERAGQDACSCPSPTVHWGAPDGPPTTWAPIPPPRRVSASRVAERFLGGGVQSHMCVGASTEPRRDGREEQVSGAP